MARNAPRSAIAPRPPGLGAVSLFAALSEADREQVARQCHWRRCSAQEQILDRDSDSRDVHFVVQGTARIIIYTASGREVALDDIEAGGFFGELAAFDGAPRSASVLAVTDCWIAVLPAARFLTLLTEHPALGLIVMQRMSAIIRTATERIVELSTLGANNRVQADLLRQAETAGVDAEGRAVIRPIPIHADIASRVSTTRETVARVLNDLARKGLVTREREALVVNDVARLEMLVQELGL
ncbi:Crp/Fnr family transcriptional regulator [Roseospira goensis]|uniref:CRP-like cAMP-binding protein n=1 Tax=Roseospira goensis TaxID=391922 RepID=A0A7W6RY33_9PROT|nr:Crp/Fnr family transcriptional regulator [Roseospira goensis]MBB4285348.1 CRP-like cAMP-binding protein [Roseospira goensis]